MASRPGLPSKGRPLCLVSVRGAATQKNPPAPTNRRRFAHNGGNISAPTAGAILDRLIDFVTAGGGADTQRLQRCAAAAAVLPSCAAAAACSHRSEPPDVLIAAQPVSKSSRDRAARPADRQTAAPVHPARREHASRGRTAALVTPITLKMRPLCRAPPSICQNRRTFDSVDHLRKKAESKNDKEATTTQDTLVSSPIQTSPGRSQIALLRYEGSHTVLRTVIVRLTDGEPTQNPRVTLWPPLSSAITILHMFSDPSHIRHTHFVKFQAPEPNTTMG